MAALPLNFHQYHCPRGRPSECRPHVGAAALWMSRILEVNRGCNDDCSFYQVPSSSPLSITSGSSGSSAGSAGGVTTGKAPTESLITS